MYIYLTTNLINQKIYIGKSISFWLKTLDYFGSGIYLKYAIKHYGKENFKKELICECSSKEELNIMEIFFIDYYDSTNKNVGYNIAKGGDGGATRLGMKNSKEHKEKVSKAIKGRKLSKEHKEKIGLSNKNKIRTNECKEKNRIWHLNKYKSEYTKQKMKDSWKLRKPMTEETKNKISNTLIGYKHTEFTKNLMSLNKFLYWAKKKNEIYKIQKLEKEIKLYKEKYNEKNNLPTLWI